MKLSEFKQLSLSAKGEIVFQEGKFIKSREYYNQRLCLYSLEEFFAEVWYEPGNNQIHRIDGLGESSKIVDRYI